MLLERPLLAAKPTDDDLRKLRYPMLLSPKIDGIRALVVGGKLVSRTMKPIRNLYTQSLFGRPELEGLDGELVVGDPWDKDLMQKTSSGVMSIHGRPAVRFFVFDRWNSSHVYRDRYELMNWFPLGRTDEVSYVVKLVHTEVNSYDELIAYEQKYLTLGYEGVMLRDPNGPYKQNRSTVREGILLKVKRFHDAEAIITGYEALNRNTNEAQVDERGYTKRSSAADGKVADDLLGSITARDITTGVHFSIGSGFTEAQRYNLWENREHLLGKIVKYKCFNVTGVKDKPRFPIFLGFRDPEDM